MLSSTQCPLARMQPSTVKLSTFARPVGSSVVRRINPPRPVAARALLLPQQDSNQSDPIDTIITTVLSWLEPKPDILSSMEEMLSELDMNEKDESHAGWGHSHIADRLATASSMSQEFDV